MRRRTVLAVLVVASWLVAGIGPAPAEAHADDLDYVALGDSYSSGLGAPGATGGCARSDEGYPARWADRHPVTSFKDVTCGGAVTGDVLDEQIAALDEDTDLVTVTIGGNDVGFARVMILCTLAFTSTCEDAIGDGMDSDELEVKVGATYAAIRRAAPNAEIVVLGYPRLFEEHPACGFGPPVREKRIVLNDAADELSARLESLATAAGLTYVDVRPAFDGHGICGDDPWINELSFSAGLGAFHPNETGYNDGYLAALEAVIG